MTIDLIYKLIIIKYLVNETELSMIGVMILPLFEAVSMELCFKGG